MPRQPPPQSVAAQAKSTFAVQYLKGKRGFGRKMDGVIVLVDDSVCFRNRRGDRAFTIGRESVQAQITTRQKRNVGCWVGLSVFAQTMLVDPEQQCRRTEYLVEVEIASADGPERVLFKPARAEASALAAAINLLSAGGEVRSSAN